MKSVNIVIYRYLYLRSSKNWDFNFKINFYFIKVQNKLFSI